MGRHGILKRTPYPEIVSGFKRNYKRYFTVNAKPLYVNILQMYTTNVVNVQFPFRRIIIVNAAFLWKYRAVVETQIYE